MKINRESSNAFIESKISNYSFTRINESKISDRLKNLSLLKGLIQSSEKRIIQALQEDLGKPELEIYSSEIAPVLHEIDIFIKNLADWSAPTRRRSAFWTLTHFGASSWVQHHSVGRVLIIGPWNYPFNLCLMPLIAAYACGNEVSLKTSEFAPATSKLLKELMREWNQDNVELIEGDSIVAAELCKKPWGHIFFTGGTEVGRKVMRAAAETLSPVTLELGGKSPCILDESVDLEVALRRILWAKFYNAGQTCIAPDYLLLPQSLFDSVVKISGKILKEFFGARAIESHDLARIINKRHYDRLQSLLKEGRLLLGGESSPLQLKIAPSLLTDLSESSPLMQEEIFGPLLPLIPYQNLGEAIQQIESRPPPLAFYIFSNDSQVQGRLLNGIRAGGVCINDCLVHFANSQLPFGGFRESGIGAYHGEESFRIFTHRKAVEKKSLWGDIKLRYPPYKIKLNKLMKKFI